MKLADLVRTARAKREVNLRDLADDVGVSASFLSRIERGEHVRISDTRLTRLAEALDLTIDEVFRCARRLPPDVEAYVLENLTRIRRSMVRAA
jgi:transcriptional regulator with XRE-family HTH domain